MNRLFVTGDCHAAYTKLGFKPFPEGRDLTKDDFVIICGDFGFWDESVEQNYWMNWLEERPFSVLWVDGNHENYDLLKKIPIKTWNGGKVQFIRPSVIHLMRGQIFEISGKSIFAFGGAKSHDIKDGILERDDPELCRKMRRLDYLGSLYRINHLSWWKEEMPSAKEREEGVRNLETAGWKVDYIISHCCATSTQDIRSSGLFESDEQTDYFSEIKERCKFTHWFFGHYHVDEDWGDKETCIYNQILEITGDGYKVCGAAKKYKYGDRVVFSTYGLHGIKSYTGTIVRVDARGGGLYMGEQPTANIRTDGELFHKNIPFEDIRKADEETEGGYD